MNKKVAFSIIRAQICSDAEKGDDFLYRGIKELEKNYLWEIDRKKGYRSKDYHIIQAISTIAKMPKKFDSGFRFHVKKDDDFGGCYIIYFNFKLYGKRKQVSFHSFNKKMERFIHKNQTRWDKGDSQLTCLELFKYMKEGG